MWIESFQITALPSGKVASSRITDMVNTDCIPNLSSCTWLEHFQIFVKIYFAIEKQIIAGFDHICCGFQNTEEKIYICNEFTKYIENINFPTAVYIYI